MKFFTGLSEAERYAKSRPYFHPLAITRAKEAANIESPVSLVMDAACGTGHSTAALMSIAERVIGIDISFNMLANAKRNERIRYTQAQAESIPLQSGTVPIVSTALAFHWFDRDQFLGEVWRVLGHGGLLLVYTNGFTGIMGEEPAFQRWSQEVYPERFPTPPPRLPAAHARRSGQLRFCVDHGK
jgi:ubiquinone/menaquinone biosynthesis C-methylase UbiE